MPIRLPVLAVSLLVLVAVISNSAGQDAVEVSPNAENVLPDVMDSPVAVEVDPATGAERPKRQFLAGLALGSLIAHRRPYYGHYGYGYPYYGGGYHHHHYPHYGYYGK